MLVQLPTTNLEDQGSVFVTPGNRVTQLYPQALGTHFSRLLRHAWVTVGLVLNPGHHTGNNIISVHIIFPSTCESSSTATCISHFSHCTTCPASHIIKMNLQEVRCDLDHQANVCDKY
jgi:hypothetical protein